MKVYMNKNQKHSNPVFIYLKRFRKIINIQLRLKKKIGILPNVWNELLQKYNDRNKMKKKGKTEREKRFSLRRQKTFCEGYGLRRRKEKKIELLSQHSLFEVAALVILTFSIDFLRPSGTFQENAPWKITALELSESFFTHFIFL